MPQRALGFSVGFLFLIAPAFLAGCKSSSFVGKRYDNFTAYYNTFYNARRAYRSGVQNREQRQETVDRTRYIGVFIQPGASGGGRDFQDAVLKSADVLREHPDSKWVDDALLLIGKSYFYENNFVGAQQKFREAIDAGTGLEEEARFWLARTYIASGDYESAELTITEALAGEINERRWRASMRLALGELRVKQGDWEAAATDLQEGLDVVRDREIAARATYLLGQVLETLGRHEEAVTAYRRTMDYRPDYELGYAAQYSAIRAEGLQVDPDAALSRLRRMERDDKHFAYRGELATLRGDILRAMGEADLAYNVYDELLYDPAYQAEIGRLRGRIHYGLAELYRDLDQDFVMAAAHFDTAASALRSGAGAPRAAQPGASTAGAQNVDPITLAPEAVSDAQEMKEAFGAYASTVREVERLDSLLWLGMMDDSTFAEKILDLRRLRAEELAERQRLQEQRQIERAFQQTTTGNPVDNRGLPEGKVIPSRNSAGGDSGFLFHDDPVMRQEGRLSFARRWGERPLVPNWRRLEAVSGAQITPGSEDGDEGFEVELTENQLPEIDISAVPRDSLSQAEMRVALARGRYDVGTTLFLGIGRPDSAAVWYRMVLEDAPDEPVARRAMYALAEIQRALGDSLAANGIYEQILAEHPESEFADRIRTLFGVEDERTEPDSLAQAEALYARYFELWDRGDHAEAANGMVTVAGTYPTTGVVPRSLLAAGSIFLEWAEADSLSIFDPIPLTVPDSMLIRAGVAEPPAILPDSLDVMGDSLAVLVAADSLSLPRTLPADSLVVPEGSRVDSLRVPEVSREDSLAAPEPSAVDSLAVREVSRTDSLAVPGPPVADSLGLGSPVEADSLVASGQPGEALGEGLDPTPPDTSAAPEPDWNRVTVKNLMTNVRTRFAGTEYANRAGELLSAIEEIEEEQQARLDSIRAARETARVDSLAALGLDPEGLPIEPEASDSVAVAPELAAADSAGVAADSVLTGTEEIARIESAGADSTLVPADTLVTLERNVPVGMAGARDAVQNVSAEMREAESSRMEPLELGEEEEAWTGWVIVLSELRDLAPAPGVRDNLATVFAGQGRPEIWLGTWPSVDGEDTTGVLVTLGRFATRPEAIRFAAGLGANLPLDAWLLHVLPFE